MDSKSSLLEQLKIDRAAAPEPARGSKTGRLVAITCAALAVLGGLAGLAFWATSRADAIPVRTAVAQSISSGGAGSPAGASILDASGYVVAMREASVSAMIIENVLSVPIQEGETVRKGQVIARLDDSNTLAALKQAEAQVAQARAALAAARIAAADARPTYLREKRELAEGLISPNAFDAEKTSYDAAQAGVAEAEQNLAVAEASVVVNERLEEETIIRAPFDGVVTAKNAQPGQIVSPSFSGGGGIADIVDMHSLQVEVDVSENYISRVHANQPAVITLDAYPDWHMPAHVIAIIPTADRSKATVKVRVAFEKLDPRILPQMGARVSFLAVAPAARGAAAPERSGVVVPSTAVAARGNTGIVYVIDGNTVESRTVRLGASTASGQEILSGLDPGATVAIGDLTKLHNGARIRITQSSL